MVWRVAEEQGVEESAKFVDGQRDQTSRGGCGCRVRWRWPRPGRRGRAWPGWSSGARRSSAGPGADRARSVLWRLGRIPRCASVAPPRATRVCSGDRAWAVAAQVGQLAGGVVAADQQMMAAGVGVVFGAAARSRPRSRGAGRGCPHRRSVSARPAGQHARGVDRRGSGRPRWARAGWPRPPARSPAGDRGSRPAAGGSAP